jgi:protein O-mannosyl-transferase
MKRTLITVLVLVVMTLTAYWKTGANEFINYDDDDYVYGNAHVQSGITLDNVRWAFTSTDAANWHPVTWLSHMADCELYGLSPRGHHLTSVALHIVNAILLLLVLTRMTGVFWRSAFVAFLFALHPLHVESVAWIAERKDVLSTFFFMLTLFAYLGYVRHPGLWRYLLALSLFALGLMSKPMLVSLPFVLLLLDYWPLRRHLNNPDSAGDPTAASLQPGTVLNRLLMEKAPFLALAIISSIVTFYAQQAGGAVHALKNVALISRIENATLAYAWYLEKALFPSHLTVFYPFSANMELWKVACSAFLLGGISFAVYSGRKTAPFLMTGWLWFLITLLPVIGLVKVGELAMADRYTYIPLIGFFLMISWGVPQATRNWSGSRTVLPITGAVILLLLSAATWHQAGYWRNSVALFEHTLRYTADNCVAENNLAGALEKAGRIEEAAMHYRNAVQIKPDQEIFHDNLGLLLVKQGKVNEAVAQFEEALRLKPDSAGDHYNMGVALGDLNRLDEAVSHFKEALRIKPDNEMYHDSLGVVLDKLGRTDEAISHFKEALRLKPDDANVHFNLGVALANQARLDEAASHFRESLRIKPDDAVVRNMLGTVLADQGKLTESAESFREALRLDPSLSEARIGLQKVLSRQAR